MQDLQIEKVEMETSCHRLEDELSMTKQQAMKKDEAHATTLSNMQVKCRDLENALTGDLPFSFFFTFKKTFL